MARVSPDRYGSPAKLVDCAEHGRGSGSELFIVEGDSAAGTVARVRCARHQAVLPMQGKPLNVSRASRSRVSEHPFFGPLAAALGSDLEARCEPSRCRYERVLVLTDPDADGIHCGFLVLVFFQRFMQPLLDAGREGGQSAGGDRKQSISLRAPETRLVDTGLSTAIACGVPEVRCNHEAACPSCAQR